MLLEASAFDTEVRVRVEDREYVIPPRATVKGTGGFAEVRVGHDLRRGVDVAVKIIQLRPVGKADERMVLREARIMRQANSRPHENVLQLLDVYVDRGGRADVTRGSPIGPAGTAYMFVELCNGGELFDRLSEFGLVPEAHACDYMRGLLAGVQHLHARGVIHRDIKLENVLLDDDHTIKLADFGLAAELAVDAVTGAPLNPNALLRDVVGSQSYVAPEVLMRKSRGYAGPPADAWSCGVCLFTLLSGFFPLDVADSRDWRFRRLQAEQARGNTRACSCIFAMYRRECPFSESVQLLLDSLLRIDPGTRATIDEALAMPALAVDMRDAPADFDGDDDGDGVVYRTHIGDSLTPVAASLAEGMPVPKRQEAHRESVLGATARGSRVGRRWAVLGASAVVIGVASAALARRR